MTPTALNDIVITGCGWVTPFAAGNIEQVCSRAASAAGRIDPTLGYWRVPDELLNACGDIPPEAKKEELVHLAAAALKCLLVDSRQSAIGNRQSAIDTPPPPLPREDEGGFGVPSERVGMVLGCALAGLSGMIDFANDVREQSPRFVSPLRFPQTVGNYLAGALSRSFDIRGPNLTIANGVPSGVTAIIEACAILRAGNADLVIAGGADRLTPKLAIGLAAPNRVLSEGACLFTLERRADAQTRGATAQASLFPSRAREEADRHSERSEESREPRASARADTPVSIVGPITPGAIAIEHIVGHSFAALGASAVAAAIAALHGHKVPIANASGKGFTLKSLTTEERTEVECHVDEQPRARHFLIVKP